MKNISQIKPPLAHTKLYLVHKKTQKESHHIVSAEPPSRRQIPVRNRNLDLISSKKMDRISVGCPDELKLLHLLLNY